MCDKSLSTPEIQKGLGLEIIHLCAGVSKELTHTYARTKLSLENAIDIY